jgi:transcriptional regulator with PAS, ATPase and Fis domain
MGLKAYLRGLIPPTFEQALEEGERRELMKMYLSVEEGDEFSLHQSLSLIQRMIIDRGLERYNRDKSKTAAMLGISDRSVRRNPTSSN